MLEAYHRRNGLFPMTLEEMLAVYHRAWEQHMPPFLFENEWDAEAMRGEGVDVLTRFYHREQENRTRRPLYFEIGFAMPLRPGFQLTGRIDRIDATDAGEYWVLDYKTSGRALERLPRPEGSLQLALYAMGSESLTGKRPDLMGFYYLNHGEVMTTTVQQHHVDTVTEAFHMLADAIEMNEFQPMPEARKCSECVYQSKCPAFTQVENNLLTL